MYCGYKYNGPAHCGIKTADFAPHKPTHWYNTQRTHHQSYVTLIELLALYVDTGVNTLGFHSHIPPLDMVLASFGY